MADGRYFVTYSIGFHRDGIEVAAVPDGHGAATSVIILSMLYPPDGSFSLALLSKDGRTGKEVDDNEIWKVWTLMAKQLSDSRTLGVAKRELCTKVFEIVREHTLRARNGEFAMDFN